VHPQRRDQPGTDLAHPVRDRITHTDPVAYQRGQCASN
jgi:hypothetical protein